MDYKISIEGEGTRLGLKTMFFKYTGVEDLDDVTRANMYVNAEIIDDNLTKHIESLSIVFGIYFTVETSSDNYSHLLDIPNVLVFKVVSSYNDTLVPNDNLFIKIRVFKEEDLPKMIQLANRYAESHNRRVLLMPEYKCDYAKLLSGKNLEKVTGGVRFMPPVQDIINIP